MAALHYFTFNPFQENTYLIFDDTKQCIIIDPGCFNATEEKELSDFITKKSLNPVKLINTHCHIDHVLGNYFVSSKYNLHLEIHKLDLPLLQAVEGRSSVWGIPYTTSPEPTVFLNHNDKITFGNTTLEIRFVPGHAPGHIVLVNHSDKTVIAGDTLFRGSVGRTDLPGGDFDVLEKSVREQLYSLPDDYVVYPGHGPQTTIGYEKKNNPFIKP